MNLYFSRITLNRKAPVRALSKLLDPKDKAKAADAHHRLIWTLFDDSSDRDRDFLWRADGKGKFYVLSARQPDNTHGLFNPPETKTFEPNLKAGDRLGFVLRANATRDQAAVSRMDKAARKNNNRRVDIVMDLLHKIPSGDRAGERMILAQTAAEGWMERQGSAKGFVSRKVAVEDYRVLELGRNTKRGLTHGILDLTGEIEVSEPDAFLSALAKGFGRAKAWGCGLMLIRRVQ